MQDITARCLYKTVYKSISSYRPPQHVCQSHHLEAEASAQHPPGSEKERDEKPLDVPSEGPEPLAHPAHSWGEDLWFLLSVVIDKEEIDY